MLEYIAGIIASLAVLAVAGMGGTTMKLRTRVAILEVRDENHVKTFERIETSLEKIEGRFDEMRDNLHEVQLSIVTAIKENGAVKV